MKKVYKFISLLLTFSILFSNISYAGGTGDFNSNAGGSDSSSASGGSGSSSAKQTLYSDTSGYRITLIDPVTSEVKSKSIDILFSEPSGQVKMFTNSRVEKLTSNESNWKHYTTNYIVQSLHNVGYTQDIEVPRWFTRVGKDFNGEGKTFKEWFLPDNALNYLSDLYNASSKVVESGENLEKNRKERVLGVFSNFNSSLISYTYTNYVAGIEGLTSHIQELYGKSISIIEDPMVSFKEKRMTFWVFLNTGYEVVKRTNRITDLTFFIPYADKLWANLEYYHPDETKKHGVKIGDSQYPKLDEKIDYTIDESYIALLEQYNKENSEYDIIDTEQGNNESSVLYIDEENKIYNTSVYGWALPILSLSDNGVSIFAKNNETSDKITDMFKKGEVYICVEPILFFKPQTEKKGNYPYTIYGTAKNWADYCVNHLSATWTNYDTGGSLFRASNRALMAGLILENNEGPWVDASGNNRLGLAREKHRIPFVKDNPYWNGRKENIRNGDMAMMIIPNGLNEPRYTFSYAKSLMDNNIGIGMQLYCVGQGTSSINTYDIKRKPNVDFYSESSLEKTTEGAEYITSKKDRTFQIVKFYRIKLDDLVIEFSHYNMVETPHIIDITDEIDIGWRLKEWYTSESTWMPDMGESPSKYNWENVVKKTSPIGTYSGTEAKNLVVSPNDPDNTLYLLYEMEDNKKDEGTKKVIKVYENEKGETEKVTEPEMITGNIYEVPVEEDYIYTESKKSDNPSKTITGWTDTEGSPSTDSKITIDESTETIYILYQKNINKQLKLYSNELSYTYGLTDLLENRVLFSIYDTIPASPGTYPSCGGHGRRGKSCTLYSHKLTDSSWTIKVSNTYDYVGLTNYLRDYENTSGLGGSWSVSSSSVGGVDISYTSSKTAKPDGTFLLYRDKASDLVTLYPKKNDSLSSSLKTLGIDTGSSSYTPHGDRMGIELSNDSSFTRDFMTGFEYTEHENVLGWSWLRSKCNTNHRGSFLTHTVTSPADANAFYNKTNSIKEYYLLGQRNTGNDEISDVRDTFGTKYSYNKAYSSTSADLKFYPYHLMLYRAKNANNSPQNVYVTSENLSTMKVYNAVQLGVYKKNPINALLSSTQWSTHARSLSFSANTDKKSVLPGGAVLDLDMGSKGDTELGIRLWQSCLRDEQVETVQQDGFNTSLSKAKEIASNYQSEVKDVLEGYGLVQWGTEGVQTDLNGVLGSGVELHNNTSLDWDNRSYNSSNDSKYYLKHNGSGSDRANFDVLDTKITKQVFYEISSDVDGNVILKKDNTEIVRASLSQDKSAILSNTEAKLLDDNTKLVSNYFSSIDRGLGDPDKYDRTNSRKYNEAYDGVGVLLTELSFSVGFSDNSGHRTTVLDTLLTSSSDSKSDLYNFAEDKVRSFVFATTDVSNDIETQGYVGTLKGDSTMQDLNTVLSDIQSFVYTKNFYTSNFNVTDLN